MKVITTSDGNERACRLVVRNVTGIAEERGFRLYWQERGYGGNFTEWGNLIPALGLVTSNPFRTARAAKYYASKNWPNEKVTLFRN